MNLTNQLSLPEPIVEAIRNDSYDPGESDYTVTGLIQPVRIRSLMRRHGDEVTEDASDRIFALLGQAIHTILERAYPSVTEFQMGIKEEPRYITEKRYYIEIDGVKVGGRIDVYDNQTKTLSDYKLCSRYVTADGLKPEWVQQCNMESLIMRENGIYVGAMQIVAIYRDWSLMAAARKDDYPTKQVEVFPVPAWSEASTVSFMRDRIKAHQNGRDAPPLCTMEERWNDGTKWAVMKKGAKRAIKLFEDKEQAEAAVHWQNGILPNPKYYLEERPAEDKRCKFYCPVAKFCDYGRLVLEV